MKIIDNFPNSEIEVEFLDSLTIGQFQDIEKAITKIEELNNIRRLLDFVVINEKEIFTFLNAATQELVGKSIKWNAVNRADTEKIFSESNRLLLNYLSSVNIFLYHCETHINRKFGFNSEKFTKFKNVLSSFYDNSFAYRFLYQLRNYSQHCGLPLDNIQYELKFDRENNKVSGTLKITFDRNKLLSEYKSWKTVKNDLEKMEDEFDVSPLLIEMTHNIREIENVVELLHKEELLNASKFVLELINHIRNDKDEFFVAYNIKTKESGEIDNYQTLEIPLNTINQIQKIFLIDK